MYLCVLDRQTGLIDLEADRDGFYAIPEFRKILLLEDKKESDYGLKVLTVIALIVDYESPIRFYSDKEKMPKAEDIVFLRRNVILFNSEIIQEAMIAYRALQVNLELEEKNMLDQMKSDKLFEINTIESNETNLKMKLIGELGKINQQIEIFDKKNSGKDMFSESPVRNGYRLQRLERKLLNKNSFYYVNQKKPELAIEESDSRRPGAEK